MPMNPGAKICPKCGQPFYPTTNRQRYCNRIRIDNCVVCGAQIENRCNGDADKQTCSVACAAELIKLNQKKSAQSLTKICKWCGEEFIPKSARQLYCSRTHYQSCVVCGKEFEIDVRKDQTKKTCSPECQYKLSVEHRDIDAMKEKLAATLQERYGVDNARDVPGSVEKAKATMLARYGEEYYTRTEAYRQRTADTSRRKYGVDHPSQSEIVKDKRRDTCQSRYGVDNVFQADEIKEKSKLTLQAKYGVEYVSQSSEVQKTIRENNLIHYGVTHPMQLKEFQDRAIQTNIDRYGLRAKTQEHIVDIHKWYEFVNDPRTFIATHYTEQPRSKQVAEDMGVDVSTIDLYLSRSDAGDCVRRAKSIMENELASLIKNMSPNIRVECNNRTVIAPCEIDIFLPEFNLAIECNPTCTHNSSVTDPWGGDPKSRSYHKQKSDRCEDAGIFLFHIFGHEWTHKREIIESMLRNLLRQNTRKVYARNTEVREVTPADARIFLQCNHRQGSATSSVRLGLYIKDTDELVSLMTFGRMRKTIGTSLHQDTSQCWELVRFCNTLNTSVVGGASKLFSAFVKQFSPQHILSFSDRAHTRGNLYSSLGFKEVRRSDPGYVWVDVRTDIAYHRMNAQKQHIAKFLNDFEIDLSRTEREIMISHGFVQVYDSGTITWRWTADR